MEEFKAKMEAIKNIVEHTKTRQTEELRQVDDLTSKTLFVLSDIAMSLHEIAYPVCSACKGTGRNGNVECPQCGGKGRLPLGMLLKQ